MFLSTERKGFTVGINISSHKNWSFPCWVPLQSKVILFNAVDVWFSSDCTTNKIHTQIIEIKMKTSIN